MLSLSGSGGTAREAETNAGVSRSWSRLSGHGGSESRGHIATIVFSDVRPRGVARRGVSRGGSRRNTSLLFGEPVVEESQSESLDEACPAWHLGELVGGGSRFAGCLQITTESVGPVRVDVELHQAPVPASDDVNALTVLRPGESVLVADLWR
jgi:hypothetical protein